MQFQIIGPPSLRPTDTQDEPMPTAVELATRARTVLSTIDAAFRKCPTCQAATIKPGQCDWCIKWEKIEARNANWMVENGPVGRIISVR